MVCRLHGGGLRDAAALHTDHVVRDCLHSLLLLLLLLLLLSNVFLRSLVLTPDTETVHINTAQGDLSA